MKEMLARATSILGIQWLVRNTLARSGVTVLLYHDPDPATFANHLHYLKRHYNPVPFADVVRALQSRTWEDIPPRSVIIHLDDGYRRNFELAAICDQLGFCPTIYLCSHVVGTRRRFWSRLMGGQAKYLRLAPNDILLRKLHDEADFTPDKEFGVTEALSEAEIQASSGTFDYQSHGRFHFSLLTLDDQTLREDLESSRERVGQLTGRPCQHFSLPYGDFTQREIAAVAAAGYRTIRTTLPGWIRRGTPMTRIPIVADVPGDISVNVLALHLTGLPRLIKRLVYTAFTQHLYSLRERVLLGRRFFVAE